MVPFQKCRKPWIGSFRSDKVCAFFGCVQFSQIPFVLNLFGFTSGIWHYLRWSTKNELSLVERWLILCDLKETKCFPELISLSVLIRTRQKVTTLFRVCSHFPQFLQTGSSHILGTPTAETWDTYSTYSLCIFLLHNCTSSADLQVFSSILLEKQKTTHDKADMDLPNAPRDPTNEVCKLWWTRPWPVTQYSVPNHKNACVCATSQYSLHSFNTVRAKGTCEDMNSGNGFYWELVLLCEIWKRLQNEMRSGIALYLFSFLCFRGFL